MCCFLTLGVSFVIFLWHACFYHFVVFICLYTTGKNSGYLTVWNCSQSIIFWETHEKQSWKSYKSSLSLHPQFWFHVLWHTLNEPYGKHQNLLTESACTFLCFLMFTVWEGQIILKYYVFIFAFLLFLKDKGICLEMVSYLFNISAIEYLWFW